MSRRLRLVARFGLDDAQARRMRVPDQPAIEGVEALGLRTRGEVEGVGDILDQVAASTQHVPLFYLWRPQLHDAKDDMVLETAVNGQAAVIVSFNVRDFGEAPCRFGIEVTRPGELLRRL